MKWLTKPAALAALLIITVGAFAQGGGGGQGRRAFGPANPGFLVRNADVQTDLKITPDQKTKLNTLFESMQAAQDNARASGSFDPEAMRKSMDDAAAQINAILTPDQQARLKQIQVQTQKNRAIMSPEVQDQLGLSSDQKDKVKDLSDKFQAAQGELRQKMRDSDDAGRTQIRADMQKNNDALEAELAKILTPEQAQKLKDLGGAPFTGKIERGFGGRRGGGGK